MDKFAAFTALIHPVNLYFFLAMEEQLDPETYDSLFTPTNLIINLLFNMGQQYEDVRDLIRCWGDTNWTGTCDSNKFYADTYFKWLGYIVGDFLMRIIYRKYYSDIEIIFFKR